LKFITYITGPLAMLLLLLQGCAVVKPYEREKLADPVMENSSTIRKQSLEEKFLSTMEGSIGGDEGVAGGCGCAK